MKALLIDAASRTIREVAYTGFKGMQRLVGGPLELAWEGSDGDTLYVNEEGLKHPGRGWFRWVGRPDQPLAGNGLLVGREMLDDEGAMLDTLAPSMSIPDVEANVRFLTHEQVQAWARANASDPATTLMWTDPKGGKGSMTIRTVGQLYDVGPPGSEFDKEES